MGSSALSSPETGGPFERSRRAPGRSGCSTVFVRPERCIGCRHCEIACAVEHSRLEDLAGAPGRRSAPRSAHPRRGRFRPQSSFPNRCRHCRPAPCEQVCPTVPSPAIRSRTWSWSRPVHRLRPVRDRLPGRRGHVPPSRTTACRRKVVATKCDGCVERVGAESAPACVEACKAGALVYGEMNELIRAGRRRESRAVLRAAATAEVEAPPAGPDTVAAWRAWGGSTASWQRGVS